MSFNVDFHCLWNYLCRKFVRLGEHDVTTNTDGPVQDIRVVKITSHEQWSPSVLANDIALLTLERDVDFSGKKNIVFLLWKFYFLRELRDSI